jgi:hypothetical protein
MHRYRPSRVGGYSRRLALIPAKVVAASGKSLVRVAATSGNRAERTTLGFSGQVILTTAGMPSRLIGCTESVSAAVCKVSRVGHWDSLLVVDSSGSVASTRLHRAA